MDNPAANSAANVLAASNPSGLPTSEQDSLNAHLHQLQQLSDRPHLAPNVHQIPASATGAAPHHYPANAADIQAQSFAAVNTTPQSTADYHHPSIPAAHPTQQQYSSDFLMQHQDPNAHSQFPFHSLQPNQKHLGALSNPNNVISSMARSHNMPQHKAPPPPVYQSNSNQLFTQPPYPQLAPQHAQPPNADRSSSMPIPHSQHLNHTRSLLQPAAPYLPQNDQVNRYPQQQQMPAQAAPNYMLQQAQHLAGVPDDFSQAQMRSHDPRAAAMVGFPAPIQQFDMQRYSGVSQGAPPLGTFTVGSTASAVADPHNPDGNALLGNPRNDAIYKPLGPRVQHGLDALPPTSTMQTAYSKTPILGSGQNQNEEVVAAAAGYRKSVKNKPVRTIKKAPRLAMAGAASSAALTAAVANQVEGVPSTVVSDAVGGSTADIDGSLIERLRGFSHVNHQQPAKQQLLLPGGPGLPPNLFPTNLDQQALTTAPTLNHDPYRVPTIRRASVGGRDPGVMLPGQPGLTIGAGGTVPLPMNNTQLVQNRRSTPEASPDRPFKCKYCQASFGRRDNMQKHERSIHMGERPFVCEICSYAFQKKDHKDKHVRTVHLKERPYQCTLCESRFGQKSDLTKHIRTVHQRIKPFRCEHCGLSFGHRGNKLRHVFVVHQKRKPHVCRICNQAFGERSNLAKHSLAVHKLALK